MAEGPFRDEFYCSKLGLSHHQPDLFVKSQWPVPRLVYLAWRGFWCVWHLVWIIISGVNTRDYKAHDSDDGVKWFVYIGNIVFLLTTITCTLDFAIVLFCTIKSNGDMGENVPRTKESGQNVIEASGSDKEEIIFQGEFTLEDDLDENPLPCSVRALWCLYNVVNCANVLVTIMHWSVEQRGEVDAIEVTVHAVNTLFVVVNLLVSATPIQVLHFLYPACFAILYFLFNLIYFLCGGTDLRGSDVIFKAIDWDEAFPTAVTIVVGLFVAIPLGHLLMFALYTFRLYLHSVASGQQAQQKRSRLSEKQNPKPNVYLTGVAQHTV